MDWRDLLESVLSVGLTAVTSPPQLCRCRDSDRSGCPQSWRHCWSGWKWQQRCPTVPFFNGPGPSLPFCESPMTAAVSLHSVRAHVLLNMSPVWFSANTEIFESRWTGDQSLSGRFTSLSEITPVIRASSQPRHCDGLWAASRPVVGMDGFQISVLS